MSLSSSTSVNYYQLNDLGYSDQLCVPIHAFHSKKKKKWKLYLCYVAVDIDFLIWTTRYSNANSTLCCMGEPLEFFSYRCCLCLHHDLSIIQTFLGLLSSLSRFRYFHFPHTRIWWILYWKMETKVSDFKCQKWEAIRKRCCIYWNAFQKYVHYTLLQTACKLRHYQIDQQIIISFNIDG